MAFPDFFDAAPRLRLRDPLAAFLGAAAGVIANVAGLLTGAARAGGFKGIGGRFVRRDLLSFGAPMEGQIRFTRKDTGASVVASARLDRVPSDPRMGALLPRVLANAASPEDSSLFRALWQERVRKLLLEHADDPQVIVLHADERARA